MPFVAVVIAVVLLGIAGGFVYAANCQALHGTTTNSGATHCGAGCGGGD